MLAGRLLRRSLTAVFALVGAALIAFAIAHLTDAATSHSLAADPVHLFGTNAPLGRLYARSSPLNLPIAADSASDANSDQMVAGLAEAVRRGGFLIAVGRWTVPAYVAGRRTPRYRVALTAD